MDELAKLDSEAFAQVWSRVDAQGSGPVEVVCPPGLPAALPAQSPGPARALQEGVATCLGDAADYRRLARHDAPCPSRRSAAELAAMARQKTAHAKRLSAACFLLTGVRYWPRAVTPVQPPEGFFPGLRRRFLAEERLAGAFRARAGQAADPHLAALYADLADQTEQMVGMVRAIVERET